MIVRVTGADGYAGTFAAGNSRPMFANHPIQLADHMNGAALLNQSLRLVVPGDKRGGRSVRDVARIDSRITWRARNEAQRAQSIEAARSSASSAAPPPAISAWTSAAPW